MFMQYSMIKPGNTKKNDSLENISLLSNVAFNFCWIFATAKLIYSISVSLRTGIIAYLMFEWKVDS